MSWICPWAIIGDRLSQGVIACQVVYMLKLRAKEGSKLVIGSCYFHTNSWGLVFTYFLLFLYT